MGFHKFDYSSKGWYYLPMIKHRHYRLLRGNEEGAVSMITVMFVILIMAVLVISFVQIMISEQRQSTDNDLSNRAFYAAESGVEDAKPILTQYARNKESLTDEQMDKFEDCSTFGDPELISDENMKTEITCQLIVTTLANVSVDSASPWHSFMLKLQVPEGRSFDRINLEWHKPENDGKDYELKNNNNLPRTSGWQEGGTPHPAGLKATLGTLNLNGATTPEDMIRDTRITHMLPGDNGTNSFNMMNGGFGDDSPRMIDCDPNADEDDYVCSATLTGLDSDNNEYYLILTPLYRATSIDVTLQNGSEEVPIEDAQASVDVTARAGDVFRRVRARLLLTDPEMSMIPDLAVGGNQICKDYRLRSDPNEFDDANRPGITDTYCLHQPN